ncbi:hypothetical protein HQ533_00955 [Candidatus Woesearchaeota archaeon]|nr:hypothetical protein [Candidatus Woesearchaeota archaeon]
MHRVAPTQELIMQLCGGNQELVTSMHHGLYETSFGAFYPHLDLTELLGFAASSWKGREKGDSMLGFLYGHSEHQIFSHVLQIGTPWINKHKNIQEEQQERYNRLNPFNGQRLEDRLARVSNFDVEKLKSELAEGVNEYVFEIQYQNRKAQRGGDNHKLEIMHFQNVYPKRGRIVPAYVAEVNRKIKDLPREYQPL